MADSVALVTEERKDLGWDESRESEGACRSGVRGFVILWQCWESWKKKKKESGADVCEPKEEVEGEKRTVGSERWRERGGEPRREMEYASGMASAAVVLVQEEGKVMNLQWVEAHWLEEQFSGVVEEASLTVGVAMGSEGCCF